MYELPAGVTTRLVTFYVDGGTALHGKLFLPRDFSAAPGQPVRLHYDTTQIHLFDPETGVALKRPTLG